MAKVFGYPKTGPKWVAVDVENYRRYPYCRICRLSATEGGEVFPGNGWLVAPGFVQTVAHNIYNRTNITLRFAGAPLPINIPDKDVEIDSRYVLDGATQKCSPHDLATLRFAISDSPKFIPAPQHVHAPPLSEIEDLKVRAIGFHFDGYLVEHTDRAVQMGPFLMHDAHTDFGHSGCPMFIGDELVAVHVGLFKGSLPYVSDLPVPTPRPLNSAILV